MKTNKLKDNRLKKLIEQDKGKAIIDYLDRQYVDECKKSSSKKTTANVSLIAKKKQKKSADSIIQFDRINVLHYNHDQPKPNELQNKLVIDETTDVLTLRPFIICCICKGLNLEAPGLFKKFLTIQTKIQDETCEKRTLATIATHDISKLKADGRGHHCGRRICPRAAWRRGAPFRGQAGRLQQRHLVLGRQHNPHLLLGGPRGRPVHLQHAWPRPRDAPQLAVVPPGAHED